MAKHNAKREFAASKGGRIRRDERRTARHAKRVFAFMGAI